MSEKTVFSDPSTIRLDPEPVPHNPWRRSSRAGAESRDVDSQNNFSKVAVYLGYDLGPDYAETFYFSDEEGVGADTGPPSGYSRQDIEAWLRSTMVPDRPGWERLGTDRQRLPVHISPMDAITETAVAINAACDSLTLASRSEDTDSAIESTAGLLTRTLALSLGVSSGRVAPRDLPDLAQRLVDPEGEVEEAVWEHLDPEIAETGLDNLEEELDEMVEREEMRAEAESFEMQRDHEWGHFPGMGGVARELGVGEPLEPRRGDASVLERDLAREADMWFGIWTRRRDRGEALYMWQKEKEQEWPESEQEGC